jgi:hypothetical protein
VSDGVTLGELARRVDRIDGRVERMDADMHTGFDTLRADIGKLSFVPHEVYDTSQRADAARFGRLEADLRDEGAARKASEERADQREWQVRVALGVAVFGTVLSVVVAVVSAAVAG